MGGCTRSRQVQPVAQNTDGHEEEQARGMQAGRQELKGVVGRGPLLRGARCSRLGQRGIE